MKNNKQKYTRNYMCSVGLLLANIISLILVKFLSLSTFDEYPSSECIIFLITTVADNVTGWL